MHRPAGRGWGRWGWGSTVVLTAVAVTACRREISKTGRVPTDTAAAMPLPSAARAESLAARVFPPESATVGTATPVAPVILYRADSVAGDVIYHRRGRCFACHGGLGRGTTKLGPDLSDSIWLNGDSSFAAIRNVIANGVATPRQYTVAMPAYAGMLDDSALAHVAAYVYALSHPGALLSDSLMADTTHRADSVAPPDTVLPPDSTMHTPPTL